MTFRTLQIPTTLPTLDELLGRPEYPLQQIVEYFLSLITPGRLNVLTIHAELEGMRHQAVLRSLLGSLRARSITMVRLDDCARDILRNPTAVPVCELASGNVDGRSGTLAVQQC